MANRKRSSENVSPKKGGKKSKQNQGNELCITCKKKAENDAVECQWCSKWEHWECGGLSNNEYAVSIRTVTYEYLRAIRTALSRDFKDY